MRDKPGDNCIFICADLGHDVPGISRNPLQKPNQIQKLLTWSLNNDNPSTIDDEPQFKMIRGGGLSPTSKFDVVSIQFAIHYMMQTTKRARRFFKTVSDLLDIGGNLVATTIDARVVIDHMMNMGFDYHFDDHHHQFDHEWDTKDNDQEIDEEKEDKEPVVVKVGKGSCQLKFQKEIVKKIFSPPSQEHDFDLPQHLHPDSYGLEYIFTLVEGSDHAAGVGQAVNLPEWLIPLPVLKGLAEEAGMVLDYAQNFHEFWSARKERSNHPMAHTALYNMNVLDWKGTISEQEWDISRMYMAVKFRKIRESNMVLEEDEDDEELDYGDDDDEPSTINTTNDEKTPATTTSTEQTDTPPVIGPSTLAQSAPKIDMSNPKAVKLFPVAMTKARALCGKDLWESLNSDERKAKTNLELAKLLGN